MKSLYIKYFLTRTLSKGTLLLKFIFVSGERVTIVVKTKFFVEFNSECVCNKKKKFNYRDVIKTEMVSTHYLSILSI